MVFRGFFAIFDSFRKGGQKGGFSFQRPRKLGGMKNAQISLSGAAETEGGFLRVFCLFCHFFAFRSDFGHFLATFWVDFGGPERGGP